MSLISRVVLFALATCSLLSGVYGSAAVADAKDIVLVRVEKSGDQYMCTVEGNRITPTSDALPYMGLDRELSKHITGRGDNQLVAIVIGRKVSLEDALLVRSVAQKVGYQTVRFFLANSEAKQMSEILLGRQFELPSDGQAGDLVPFE